MDITDIEGYEVRSNKKGSQMYYNGEKITPSLSREQIAKHVEMLAMALGVRIANDKNYQYTMTDVIIHTLFKDRVSNNNNSISRHQLWANVFKNMDTIEGYNEQRY